MDGKSGVAREKGIGMKQLLYLTSFQLMLIIAQIVSIWLEIIITI